MGYGEGPHKLISDSLYSLIIFIYVSITFLYMFYAFCWREAQLKPLSESEKQVRFASVSRILSPGKLIAKKKPKRVLLKIFTT